MPGWGVMVPSGATAGRDRSAVHRMGPVWTRAARVGTRPQGGQPTGILPQVEEVVRDLACGVRVVVGLELQESRAQGPSVHSTYQPDLIPQFPGQPGRYLAVALLQSNPLRAPLDQLDFPVLRQGTDVAQQFARGAFVREEQLGACVMLPPWPLRTVPGGCLGRRRFQGVGFGHEAPC